MTTFRAVARHRVGASPAEKRRELTSGLTEVVFELLEAGENATEIEALVENACIEWHDEQVSRREAEVDG